MFRQTSIGNSANVDQAREVAGGAPGHRRAGDERNAEALVALCASRVIRGADEHRAEPRSARAGRPQTHGPAGREPLDAPMASRRPRSAAPSAPARCGRCSLQSRHASAVGRRVRETAPMSMPAAASAPSPGAVGAKLCAAGRSTSATYETVRDGDSEASCEVVVARAPGAHRLAPRDRAQAARRAQGCEGRETLERACDLVARKAVAPVSALAYALDEPAAGERLQVLGRGRGRDPSGLGELPTDHARPSKSASTIAARAGAASRRPSAARSVVSCMETTVVERRDGPDPGPGMPPQQRRAC